MRRGLIRTTRRARGRILAVLAGMASVAAMAGSAVAGRAQEVETREVPASAFGGELESLEEEVLRRLQAHGRDAENQEILAALRTQRDEGLIPQDRFEEATAALGPAPLTLGGEPFSGTVYADRAEATFEGGRLTAALFRDSRGAPEREIRLDGGAIRETRFWGGPYGDAPRQITRYQGPYMGSGTTRILTPGGELIQETAPDGTLRHGDGWMGGVNMWQEDNAFYRRVEACQATRLYVNGSWFSVQGPEAGGCAVEYGHWASPDPGRPELAGTSMVCVHRGGSAYDFINALHGQQVPGEECRGSLVEALTGGGGGP